MRCVYALYIAFHSYSLKYVRNHTVCTQWPEIHAYTIIRIEYHMTWTSLSFLFVYPSLGLCVSDSFSLSVFLNLTIYFIFLPSSSYFCNDLATAMKRNKNRLFNALLIVELPMNSVGYWEFHRNQHANDKQAIFNMTRIHLHARNKREFGPSVCINRQNDNCISIFDFDYLFL